METVELRHKIAKLISEGRSGNIPDERTAERILSLREIADALS